MTKKKPVGWRREHARHVAAGKGMETGRSPKARVRKSRGKKNVIIDLAGFQEADDGNTAYYGGVAKVNGVEIGLSGTDRDAGYIPIIIEEIVRQLGRELSDDEIDNLEEAIRDKSMGRGKVTWLFRW